MENMNDHLDPDKIRIPAYMRKKAIVRQSRQKLILTALDRKQAGLDVHSQKPLAIVKEKSYITTLARKPAIKKVRATSFPAPPKSNFFGNDSAPKHLLQDTWPSHEEPQMDVPEPQQYAAATGFAEIHPIGRITAYLEKIQVAIILLDKPLRQGDLIQITADGMLFQQPVESMQLNRKDIKLAKKGSEIGLKVGHAPQLDGTVYKVQI